MRWRVVKDYKAGDESGEAAPFLKATISRTGLAKSPAIVVDALLDTGAAFGLLPSGLPETIFLLPLGRASYSGVEGVGTETPAYYPTVKLESWHHEFRAIKFGTWEGDYAIIGRNLLESVLTQFDGPNLEVRIRG